MKNILVLVFVLLAFNGIAQDKVIFNDEHVVLRDVPGFQAVVVKGPFKVYYSSDAETQVAVSAKDNDARDRITTKVSGGTLYVTLDNSGAKWWGVNKPVYNGAKAPMSNCNSPLPPLVTSPRPLATDRMNLPLFAASRSSLTSKCSSA